LPAYDGVNKIIPVKPQSLSKIVQKWQKVVSAPGNQLKFIKELLTHVLGKTSHTAKRPDSFSAHLIILLQNYIDPLGRRSGISLKIFRRV
jgi:hypothetical protein